MSAFYIKKKLYGNSQNIPSIAEQIHKEFVAEGYEVRIAEPSTGQEISLRVDYLKLRLVFVQL